MTWRKSSYSGAEANCVELNQRLDAVRDSKNPSGPTILVPTLGAFVRAAKSGRFDR